LGTKTIKIQGDNGVSMTVAEHVPKSSKSARSNYLSFDNELGINAVEGAVKLPHKEAAHSVPIVVDCGSWNFRAGYANEQAPSRT
jgi:hypothetical protein